MTYCDRCRKEIENDEWRHYIKSDGHLKRYGEKDCDVCKMKCTIIKNDVYFYESERNHNESDFQMKNQERLGFHSS